MSDHLLDQLDSYTTGSDSTNSTVRNSRHDNFRELCDLSKSNSKKVKPKTSNESHHFQPSSQPSTRIPTVVSQARNLPSADNQPTLISTAQEKTLSGLLRVLLVLETIFAEDVSTPSIKTELPQLEQLIETTQQLSYCNALLLRETLSQPKPTTREAAENDGPLILQELALDQAELDWLETTKKDPMEAVRLRWLAAQVVEEFVMDVDKDSAKTTEIVSLGHVLQKEPYRKLLSTFIKEFEDAPILNVDMLQGLLQLVQDALPDYLVSDDLVKILAILRVHLESTHQQWIVHSYHLTLAVSRILDVMAEHQVQDLDRVLEHEPISAVLSGLKGNSDPYLMYQVCYAFQALQFVLDNESALQAVLRHSTGVIDGLVKVTGVFKLNLGAVLEGLGSLQKSIETMAAVAGTVYKGVSSLMESGQGVLDSLKEGLGSDHKRLWYPAVRIAYAFAQAGQLKDLKKFIFEAPCRLDPLFQWGICQLLGEIAVDPAWAVSARQQSVSLLSHLCQHDRDWGQDESVKAWTLTIITQLSLSDQAVSGAARSVLQELTVDQSILIKHPFRLRSRLPIPDTSPLLAKIQSVQLLEHDLHKFRWQRLQESTLSVYISLLAKSDLQARDDELFSLTERVQEFLLSERQVMLILGDSGSGKSTFNRYLEHQLWTNYAPGDPIPLFIHLSALDRPDRELVAKKLREINFSEEQIHALRLHRRFVLVCDGYDESQLIDNLHTANRFNRPGQWNVKMVISCRTQFLGQNYRSRFLPDGTGDYTRQASDLFQEAVIAPFSEEQIERYVKLYAQDSQTALVFRNQAVWSAKEYMDKLTTIPNVKDLVKNPFLLTLALKALPRLVASNQDLPSIRVTRVKLYDMFVDQWLELNRLRLQSSTLSKEELTAFNSLVDDGFIGCGINYLLRLSEAIFQEQDGNPVVQYLHRYDNISWKSAFFGTDPKTKLLRDASPLVRSGNKYQFIHRSMLEYFLSRVIYDPAKVDEQDFDSSIETVSPVSPTCDTNGPLYHRNLLEEPLIIQFLCDRVSQDPIFGQRLHAVIEQSKTDPATAVAATNAITILVRAGVSFNGADLQGVRIPGADLSGGEFDSVQFQGADLTAVNFTKSWIRQADFSNAVMSRVQFGEWPTLNVDKEPTACVYSNEGDTFAVGLTSGDIEVYDTATLTRTFTLSGHLKAVTALSYHPTSHQLFSSSRDGSLRFWNLKSDLSEQTFGGQGGVVSSIAVSPDGQQLATGGTDRIVRLWFSDNLLLSHSLPGHIDAVTCLAYSPDGSVLASGSSDETVRIWDTGSGNTTFILKGHIDSVSSIAYAPNGQQFVSGSNDTTVRVWDMSTKNSLATFTNHTDRVSSVAYSPDGQYIVSASWDMTVRIWRSISPFDQVSVLRGVTKKITGLSVSPAGLAQVAACCNDKTVRLWDVTPSVSDTSASGVSAIAISPDEQLLTTSGYDSTIRICNPTTGNTLGPPLRTHKRSVAAVAFSPTAQVLASASWDHTIHIWNTERRQLSKVIYGHLASVTSLTFLPSGHLISGSADWTIRIWNLGLDSQEPVRTFKGHTRGVRGVACSPDGSRIASASEDKNVRVWTLSVPSEEREVVFEGHSDAVACVTFSPVGGQIASASEDKSIRLWNIERSGSEPTILLGHQAGVQSVAYSACGQYLASGSDDNSFIVWSVSSCSVMKVITDFYGGISSIVWKQGGLELIVGCKDSSVRAWRLLTEEDRVQIRLKWSIGLQYLVATDARIDGALLDIVAFKLLKKWGAVGEISKEDNENELE